jgi:hypothetical protein
MNKKKVIVIGGGTIIVAILLAFVLNSLFKIHSDGVFAAEWGAGDALNYIASIFGAVGSIVLGYVAYKQNDRLQELENNNYIANYSSMLIMNKIDIEQKPNIPVNWEIHSEQIVVDGDIEDEYVGYKFTFTACSIGTAIPTRVHIKECNIFCGARDEEVANSYLFGKNYSDVYSRVAIHKDNIIKFGMTYVVNAKKRKNFEEAIRQNSYSVTVEVLFDIITDKNVITKCKCRSYCCGQNCANKITWEGKDPMVFFYGHDIANEDNIKISGEVKNNG